MTAMMVLRLSFIVQGLVIRVWLPDASRALDRAACKIGPWWTGSRASKAAGRGDGAPTGGPRAWSQSHDLRRHGGRLAHNHCVVAMIGRRAVSPAREAGAGCGCAR